MEYKRFIRKVAETISVKVLNHMAQKIANIQLPLLVIKASEKIEKYAR